MISSSNGKTPEQLELEITQTPERIKSNQTRSGIFATKYGGKGEHIRGRLSKTKHLSHRI